MNTEKSFDGFYRKYKNRIFSYLLRMTGDYHRSLDFMQESFAKYFSSYQNKGNNSALLYTIAKNTALDSIRKQKEEILTENNQTEKNHNPESQLIEKQNIIKITSAIAQLEPLDRKLIMLVAAKRLSYKEIGKHLNISETNLKVKVHRARIRLREILKNGGQ